MSFEAKRASHNSEGQSSVGDWESDSCMPGTKATRSPPAGPLVSTRSGTSVAILREGAQVNSVRTRSWLSQVPLITAGIVPRLRAVRLAHATCMHYVAVVERKPPLMVLGRSGVRSPLRNSGGAVAGR